MVGNATVTAGSSAVLIAGHTVAFLASSVLAVDAFTTTLASPDTGSLASATVIAGLTVQAVGGMGTATATADNGFESSSSSSQPMSVSGALTLSAVVPRTFILGYGSCLLALLLAQAIVQIVR